MKPAGIFHSPLSILHLQILHLQILHLQILLDEFYHLLVLFVREIDLAWVHTEEARVVRSADVLWCKVEVEVRECVRECAVVDLLRVEGTLHGTCSLCDVGHKVVALLVVELVEVIDVSVVCHEASAVVCLLLEEEDA